MTKKKTLGKPITDNQPKSAGHWEGWMRIEFYRLFMKSHFPKKFHHVSSASRTLADKSCGVKGF
jgi:hypothetical protein